MQPKTSGTTSPDKASTTVLRNYINGKWIPSSGSVIPDINPANTDDVLCYSPLSTREETSAAVAAAKEAYPKWKATPPPQRGRLLFKAMSLLHQRLEEV